MGITRRDFLTGITGLAGASLLGAADLAAAELPGSRPRPSPAFNPALGYLPIVTPGIPTLPFEWDGNVKVFKLWAEPVTVEFPDMSNPHGIGKRPINCWGYNGTMIGPTFEVVDGDTVRIQFKNNLPDPTTVHWHGLHIPIGMDGVPVISQPEVMPGESFTYEFTIDGQSGTYFYHSHVLQAKQVGLGLMGFFIVHPKKPEPWQIVQRDYAYFLQTWKIDPGRPNPDLTEMTEFNYFTMNGRPGPDIVPMEAKRGEKVRIRVANLSMLTHPVHLHGHTFKITDWGGGFLPQHQHIAANTIDVSNAEVRTLEFEAKLLGKWLFHCHFSHHTMNDMHRRPIPGIMGHSGHADGGMHTYIDIT